MSGFFDDTYYHGTWGVNIDSILQGGLLTCVPGKSNYNECAIRNRLFFATTPDECLDIFVRSTFSESKFHDTIKHPKYGKSMKKFYDDRGGAAIFSVDLDGIKVNKGNFEYDRSTTTNVEPHRLNLYSIITPHNLLSYYKICAKKILGKEISSGYLDDEGGDSDKYISYFKRRLNNDLYVEPMDMDIIWMWAEEGSFDETVGIRHEYVENGRTEHRMQWLEV